jgi:hypothetical protein
MAWSTFVVAGYWAFEPDLSAGVRIDPVWADLAHIVHFLELAHLELAGQRRLAGPA